VKPPSGRVQRMVWRAFVCQPRQGAHDHSAGALGLSEGARGDQAGTCVMRRRPLSHLKRARLGLAPGGTCDCGDVGLNVPDSHQSAISERQPWVTSGTPAHQEQPQPQLALKTPVW
jgi:hypothetical protein